MLNSYTLFTPYTLFINQEQVNYLTNILNRCEARDLTPYQNDIAILVRHLTHWASTYYISIEISGSRAKGTAISLGSDLDLLISLSNQTIGDLQSISDSLHVYLRQHYPESISRHSVCVRLNLNGLEVDITPARKQYNQQHYHSIYVANQNTWKQTNIHRHIRDISTSSRTNEIRLLKIWRQLNNLSFPSIYLEYLLIDIILYNRSTDKNALAINFRHVLQQLAIEDNAANPLFMTIVDPANSNNILSDLLTQEEKNAIRVKANMVRQQPFQEIFGPISNSVPNQYRPAFR